MRDILPSHIELTLWGPENTVNSGIDVVNLRAYVLRSGGCSYGRSPLIIALMMRGFIEEYLT